MHETQTPLLNTSPAGHKHPADPDGEVSPAGQSWHVVDPAGLEYLPGVHGLMYVAPTCATDALPQMGCG
jgi:hypothetical protein